MHFLFEEYALDTGCRELRVGERVVPVAPQVFDLLEHLIRNRDRVISKDDLILAIWGGRVVSEAAITTRMSLVRHAVGDNGDEQRLIKTFARKGFRFVAAVREENRQAAVFSLSGPAGSRPSFHRPSIAVLPFADHLGDVGPAQRAENIAETVVTGLVKRRWLIVVDPGWSQNKLDVPEDARQIGRRLGVRYVLRGKIRYLSDRVRVASQVMDVTAGSYLWAGYHDLDLTNGFATDDNAASSIVDNIATSIADAERWRAMRKAPESLDAWDAYQLGMWHMTRCEAGENQLAQSYFRRAIDLDANFAAGLSGLAWSYMMAASIFSEMTIAEGCLLGEPLARKSVALDEGDLEARARLSISAMLRGDLEGAFESAERVLSVDGRCAEALGVKGTALLYSGRRSEGRDAIWQHLRLSPGDPARPIRLSQIAASLYLDEDYSGAAATARTVIRQYPKHPTAYRWLAASLGQIGRVEEAEVVLEYLRTTSPSSFDMYIRQRPKYCSIEHAPLVAGLRKAGWKE